MNTFGQALVDRFGLFFQGIQRLLDIFLDFPVRRLLQPIAFLVDQVQQLTTTLDEGLELLLFFRLSRLRCGLHHLPVERDHPRVDRVGFGVAADPVCELAHTSGIDHRHRDLVLMEQGHQAIFIATGGLGDHDRAFPVSDLLNQLADDRLFAIIDRQGLAVEKGDIQLGFRNINSNEL